MSTALEREERREYVEGLLVKRIRTSSAVRDVRERYDVSAETVYNDIKAIRTRWREEAGPIDREDRRRHLMTSIDELYERAMKHQSPAYTEGGKPVYTEDGSREYIDDPKYSAAVRALGLLADIHGLKKLDVTVDIQQGIEQLIGKAKRHMTPDAYEQLIRGLAVEMGEAAPQDDDDQAEDESRVEH